MERRRGRQDLVRAGEVAAVVPAAAERDAPGHPALADLRRSGLLTEETTSTNAKLAARPYSSSLQLPLKMALANKARELGFDLVGVARPDAIPQALPRLQQFLAEGAH